MRSISEMKIELGDDVNIDIFENLSNVSSGTGRRWPNGRKINRPSKWTGEQLREIRAKNGVGRPPKV